MQHTLLIDSEIAMRKLGEQIARQMTPGSCIELIGDVGAGKTTFVKGLGAGLGVDEDVQSPSFTISRVYTTPAGRELHHYDFYRLPDAGILEYEFAESLNNMQAITVVEWADVVAGILPAQRVRLTISAIDETRRKVILEGMEMGEDYDSGTKD